MVSVNRNREQGMMQEAEDVGADARVAAKISQEQRMLSNYRGRRIVAFQAAEMLDKVVKNLGVEDGSQLPLEDGLPPAPSEAVRGELLNGISHLLRLILVLNDGHVSSDKLKRF
jgi:hypothetical protein